MKLFFRGVIFFISISVFSQSKFPDWDKNYSLKDPVELILNEIKYSKKIEKNTELSQYFVSANKYRFLAKFTGKTRDIPSELKKSMARVVLVKFGKKGFIEDIVDKEYEFIIGNKKSWLAIQKVLENDFIKEIKVNSEVLLYTLFLNEHTSEKRLFNNFLISEFSSDWN